MRYSGRTTNTLKALAIAVVSFSGLIGSSSSPWAADDLATRATNPAAPLIQLQLQDSFTPSSHGVDGWANSGIVQPVMPFVLGDDYYFQSIITRTTIPFVSTGEVAGKNGKKRKNGVGDTTVMIVPAHKQAMGTGGNGFEWGPIAAIQLPTGSTRATGSGHWAAGPGLLAILSFNSVAAEGDALQIGGFGYNIWSFAETRSTTS